MRNFVSIKNADSIETAISAGAEKLAQSDTARLDARILMKHVLQTDDAGLIARARDPLEPSAATDFEACIVRRAKSEPIAYITGAKEFWSLDFHVTPDVLIPRDDSGALIEAVLARRGRDERLRIADLGTGSGCLLCALLTAFPTSTGVGIDLSARALRVAGANAQALGLGSRAAFVEGDWLSGQDELFDLVVANPPYIRESDRDMLARDIADFEPADALFAGEDGLDAYRAILAQLPSRLSDDALAVMECGADQTELLARLLAGVAGDAEVFTIKDLAGRPRGAGFDRRSPANQGKKRV